MIDHLKAEVKEGLELALPDLRSKDQEASILYCFDSLERELQRRIKASTQGKKKKKVCTQVFRGLSQALHDPSEAGCLESFQLVLSAAPDDVKEQLENTWGSDATRWGMFARQRSPLLLQHMSIMPIVSYHNQVKATPKEKVDLFQGETILFQWVITTHLIFRRHT
jgi:hypothetical protein